MTKNFFDDREEPLTPTPIGKQSGKSLFSKLYGNKPKKALLIIIPLIIVVLSATYFFYRVIKKPKTYNNTELTAAKTLENINQINANAYIDLEPMVINLAPSSAKQNYLKLTVTLQFASDIETKVAQLKLPNIIDSFQTFLREVRANDLNSSGSMLQLKEELMKRVNKVIYPVVIENILFKEMLVN